MGGFNNKTGVFSLTHSKASAWCRRRDPNRGEQIMECCARLLREAGLEVLATQSNYLTVKATPGQVWEALSGQSSDLKRESVHL